MDLQESLLAEGKFEKVQFFDSSKNSQNSPKVATTIHYVRQAFVEI